MYMLSEEETRSWTKNGSKNNSREWKKYLLHETKDCVGNEEGTKVPLRQKRLYASRYLAPEVSRELRAESFLSHVFKNIPVGEKQ